MGDISIITPFISIRTCGLGHVFRFMRTLLHYRHRCSLRIVRGSPFRRLTRQIRCGPRLFDISTTAVPVNEYRMNVSSRDTVRS